MTKLTKQQEDQLYLVEPLGSLYVIRNKKDVMPGGDIAHIWVMTLWGMLNGKFTYALKTKGPNHNHGFFNEFLTEAEALKDFTAMFEKYSQ